MRLSFPCPHCDARSTAVKTRRISWKSIEVGYRCTDIDCGHTFVAVIEAIRTLSPSSRPRPGVNLPLGRHLTRTLLVTQMLHASEAEGGAINGDKPAVTGDLFDAIEHSP
jgi:hypothetical protein